MATASPITTALFWSKVEIPENRVDCWRWKETINGNGYGRYWVRPHWIAAHRFSYEQFKGAIPEGLQVRHLCHNRLCCNPDHLDVGTAKENARDSIDAGRFTKGSTNGNSKLTEADVIHIRKTALEMKVKAKIADVAKAAYGIKAPKQKIASRGFPRTKEPRAPKPMPPARNLYTERVE